MNSNFMPGLVKILTLLFIAYMCTSAEVSNEKKSTNILGLFAHPSESHFAVMRSVMTELAHRGYNVTVYSSHRLNQKYEHLQEIIIEPEFEFWKEMLKRTGVKDGLNELSQSSPTYLQKYLGEVGAASAEYFLASPQVQKLLNIPSEEFSYDLIIVDLFYTEALLALGHAHNKPVIGIVSSDFENYMQHMLESFIPIACTPFNFESGLLDAMPSYWSRLSSIRECIARRKDFNKYNLNAQQQLIRKYFHKQYQALEVPTIGQLQSHLALIFVNNHVPLSVPRPLLLNTINAGGLHIPSAQELPWHFRRFIEESRVGVIYINLGNEQLCGEIPPALLQTLLIVLGKRRERVVWTCHDVDKFPDQPKNILIQHVVSQTDILAHPHVKIFVMNGDLLSVQEGLVRHVPMLGIPIFRNQVNNMDTVLRLGIGLRLAYDNITTISFDWALQTLIEDSNMPLALRRAATEFRDRPLGALETSMYWISYVLRHKGGAELKTSAIGLTSSSQLHLFDLFIFYFAMATLIVSGTVALFYTVLFIRNRQAQKLTTKMN